MDTDKTAADGEQTIEQPAITLTERGVVIEGQRIASAMSDGDRELLAHAPLVILPDVVASWRDYRAILEQFAASRRVFALDWPGFGASAHPTPAEFAYTLDHYTSLFGLWLDSLGVARAVLLGHGLVGPLGLAPQGAVESLAERTLLRSPALLQSPGLVRLVEAALTSLALGPTTEQTQAIEAERRAARKQPSHAIELAATMALPRDAEAARPAPLALGLQVSAPG